ncbi:hypothetical protein FGO68_gene8609 [Halteria grandinella]|uniref:Uncharacterized protein n=1 Tax=Halteria grandinella TaxID=5974 RepID=A0A8J8T9Z4_HALGN|nr:hypothetical protein FGO68_gene8609 [Halteria grandinella]
MGYVIPPTSLTVFVGVLRDACNNLLKCVRPIVGGLNWVWYEPALFNKALQYNIIEYLVVDYQYFRALTFGFQV